MAQKLSPINRDLCPGFPDTVKCCKEVKEVAQSPEARKLMAVEMPNDPLTPYDPSSGRDNPAVIRYDQFGNPINFETQPEVLDPNQGYWRG